MWKFQEIQFSCSVLLSNPSLRIIYSGKRLLVTALSVQQHRVLPLTTQKYTTGSPRAMPSVRQHCQSFCSLSVAVSAFVGDLACLCRLIFLSILYLFLENSCISCFFFIPFTLLVLSLSIDSGCEEPFCFELGVFAAFS